MPVNCYWTLDYFCSCEFTLRNDRSLRSKVDSEFTVPDLFQGILPLKPIRISTIFLVDLVDSDLG
jgi:hypothetical protein